MLGLPCWHKTRGVSPQICDTLTPAHSTIVCHHFQGRFVSPMRVALSARVSPHDQHTLAMHMDALRAFATRCGWTVIATSAAGFVAIFAQGVMQGQLPLSGW